MDVTLDCLDDYEAMAGKELRHAMAKLRVSSRSMCKNKVAMIEAIRQREAEILARQAPADAVDQVGFYLVRDKAVLYAPLGLLQADDEDFFRVLLGSAADELWAVPAEERRELRFQDYLRYFGDPTLPRTRRLHAYAKRLGYQGDFPAW